MPDLNVIAYIVASVLLEPFRGAVVGSVVVDDEPVDRLPVGVGPEEPERSLGVGEAVERQVEDLNRRLSPF